MKHLAARVGAGALSVAVLVASALTAGAASATTPPAPIVRWHLIQRSHETGSTGYQYVTATGPRNAWVLGSTGSTYFLVHWNGRDWRRQAMPRGFEAQTIAASSPTNVWAFGTSLRTDAYEAGRWNGRSWTVIPMPLVPSGYPVVLSPSDVWMASDGGQLLHWNGAAWKKSRYDFPGWQPITTAGGQLWRVDAGRVGGHSNRLIVRRWNGLRWVWVSSPHPALGSNPSLEISASSSHNLWISIHWTRFLHWNGSRWSRVGRPPAPYDRGGLAAGGRSRVWLGGLAEWNGKRWLQATPALACPSSSAGAAAAVPGTSSALCVADVQKHSGGNYSGQVWLAGRLP